MACLQIVLKDMGGIKMCDKHNIFYFTLEITKSKELSERERLIKLFLINDLGLWNVYIMITTFLAAHT